MQNDYNGMSVRPWSTIHIVLYIYMELQVLSDAGLESKYKTETV